MVPSMIREPDCQGFIEFSEQGKRKHRDEDNPNVVERPQQGIQYDYCTVGKNPGQIVGGVQHRIQDESRGDTGGRGQHEKGRNHDFCPALACTDDALWTLG